MKMPKRLIASLGVLMLSDCRITRVASGVVQAATLC
jgi:hypothetical protein